jgi:outer membrane receptor for ferrienterochelin and colicin
LRVDYHSLFGTIFIPRLHVKYDVTKSTALRLSAGRGWRLANVLTENTGVLVSSRQLVFNQQRSDAYGFKPDQAWNFGANLSQNFTVDYRPGSITVDYYFTDFESQALLDLDKSAREANFFALTGKSFSQSLQVQVDYELIRRFDVRLAYRWLNVETDYLGGRLQRPMISRDRAFVNLAYETKNLWMFDYTVQWLGSQRLPNTQDNPISYQALSKSPDYVLMNAQITKDFSEKFSAYLGIENLTDFKLEDPIIASDQPFSPYFDSSFVWGPVFGRMAYVGFRYRLK